jgi:phage shock protein PspC (stress-responsive transcriptional regulator)
MSPADEIAKLHELLLAGRLTQAEFEQGKARILGMDPRDRVGPALVGSQLRRSATDCWLGGVCGGLGKATGAESWLWRLIFVAAALFAGFGAVVYLLLWIFVPPEAPPGR